MRTTAGIVIALCAGLWLGAGVSGDVCNLKVVTDAGPDYTDMQSMIHSITSRWPTMKERCWAMWYWNHLARRQTTPMVVHGQELTDPIMQFNDYGYTQCSTVAGIYCGIWHHMGMKVKYWDIYAHTVPECFYDGRWHMYDSSMTAIYTLCDGVTVAGVEDIGKEGACEASAGRKEKGHVARYHCLTGTGPNGYLTGADCARSLASEAGCFNPASCSYRYYYNGWDWGHRYILNLRPGETYTRTCHRLDAEDQNALVCPPHVMSFNPKTYKHDPKYYVSNPGIPGEIKDPESVNPRYFIRGNGKWTSKPELTPASYRKVVHSETNVAAVAPTGLQPLVPAVPAEVVFKVNAANVATSQVIKADFFRRSADDVARISVSTSNGRRWDEVWKAEAIGEVSANVDLTDEVNGAYQVLIRVEMQAKAAAADVRLKNIEVQTLTQLNSRTQPRLNLGRNTVYVGLGEQTDAIVLWPELQGESYKRDAVECQNVKTDPKHEGWHAVTRSAKPGEDSWLVYRVDAPRDVTGFTYGARMYNRHPGSHIDLLHSLDDGTSWTRTWSLTDTASPWDVIHYETVDKVPPGTRSVLFKYLWNDRTEGQLVGGLYSVRMEVRHRPADVAFQPVEVTFAWHERHGDAWGENLVRRSHTQLVTRVPFKYTVNVGGDDVPEVESLRVNLKDAAGDVAYGYSDGRDVGGEKSVGRWASYGKNLALGKTYTLGVPSVTDYGASADPEGKVLTDGIVAPCYMFNWGLGLLWKPNTNPVITLDLGAETPCAAFGLNFMDMGDLYRNGLAARTRVEVLVSPDDKDYASIGFLDTKLRWKDIPVNFMMPDDKQVGCYSFYLVGEKPVKTRYVRYRVTSGGFFCCTELLVPDAVGHKPFDLRIALPDE